MSRSVVGVVIVLAALVASPARADKRGDAKAQVAFGIRVAQAGLWREALFRFERAVHIDPTYAAAWNNLAIAYEQMGEEEKSRQAYEKALRIAPKDLVIRSNYDTFKEVHERKARGTHPAMMPESAP